MLKHHKMCSNENSEKMNDPPQNDPKVCGDRDLFSLVVIFDRRNDTFYTIQNSSLKTKKFNLSICL